MENERLGIVSIILLIQERILMWEDLQHNLLVLTLNDKLGLAPPNSPDAKVKHVLDVGTGTGIWALDFADEHPEAEVSKDFEIGIRSSITDKNIQVIGVDLSPIQPSL